MSESVKIKVSCEDGATLPVYKTEGAAGADVCAFLKECVLATKTKKIKDLDLDFVLDCYNNKDFAQDIVRDYINACSEIDLSIEAFFKLSLEALQEISHELEQE